MTPGDLGILFFNHMLSTILTNTVNLLKNIYVPLMGYVSFHEFYLLIATALIMIMVFKYFFAVGLTHDGKLGVTAKIKIDSARINDTTTVNLETGKTKHTRTYTYSRDGTYHNNH